MEIKTLIRNLLLACLLVGSSMAYADDDLDVTMRMVPPGVELPDAVTKVISLPGQTPDNARNHAQKGLDTANDARGAVEIPQVEVPQIELPEQSRGRGRN